MKNIFIKIASLIFIAVLLSSNLLNLYVYFHHQEDKHSLIKDWQEGNDSSEDSECELCLLTFHLNNLDYFNTESFSFEKDTLLTKNSSNKVIAYKALLNSQLYTNSNRNKAPPYSI